MSNVQNIFRLLFLGIFTAFVFNYLAEVKINYIKHFLKISVLHLLATILIIYVFNNTFSIHLNVSIGILLLLFISLILAINVVYILFRGPFRQSIADYHERRGSYAFSLSQYYTVSKSFNVLFQQSLILASIYSLLDIGLKPFQIVMLFAVVFGIAHIFLVDHKKPYTLFVIIASFFGGGLFSFVILFFPFGFIYAYLLHWLFLISLGIYPHLINKTAIV